MSFEQHEPQRSGADIRPECWVAIENLLDIRQARAGDLLQEDLGYKTTIYKLFFSPI